MGRALIELFMSRIPRATRRVLFGTSETTFVRVIWLGFAFVFGGTTLLVSAIVPWPDWWGSATAPERFQIAGTWLALLGLGITLLVLGAGIAELRHVFPQQLLTARVAVADEGDEDIATSYVVLENPRDGPLVNAYYVEVILETSEGEPVLEPPPQPTARSGLLGFDPGLIVQSIREPTSPPDWLQEWSERDSRWYFWWERQRAEPWFPSQQRSTPAVPLSAIDEGMRWRVRWTTDRAGPVEITLPVCLLDDVTTGD